MFFVHSEIQIFSRSLLVETKYVLATGSQTGPPVDVWDNENQL